MKSYLSHVKCFTLLLHQIRKQSADILTTILHPDHLVYHNSFFSSTYQFISVQVSENILGLYLDEYKDTPWDALKYLIAGICYGGHVTDDWDRRLLLTYINTYFNNDAINIPFFKQVFNFILYLNCTPDLFLFLNSNKYDTLIICFKTYFLTLLVFKAD